MLLLPAVVVGVRLLPSVVLVDVVWEGDGAAREGVDSPGVPKKTTASRGTRPRQDNFAQLQMVGATHSTCYEYNMAS
jgi:hypothetical protein